jgi:hypothetical protein
MWPTSAVFVDGLQGPILAPVADPATERRKSGLFQVGAASARARSPFVLQNGIDIRVDGIDARWDGETRLR